MAIDGERRHRPPFLISPKEDRFRPKQTSRGNPPSRNGLPECINDSPLTSRQGAGYRRTAWPSVAVPVRRGRSRCGWNHTPGSQKHEWRRVAVSSATFPLRTTPGLTGAGFGLLRRRLCLLHRDWLQEWHHGAQALAHLLDQLVLLLDALLAEPREAGFVLRDPAAGVSAVLDFLEDLPHRLAGLVGDDARPAGVVAVLGGIADRIPHVVEPALVDEVDDQLQLVHALEVGDLGLIAGLDQSFEPRLHQRAYAAAEHRLFAEQVSLGLFREGGLDDSGAGGADSLGIGE